MAVHHSTHSLMRAVTARVDKKIAQAHKILGEEIEDTRRDYRELTSGTVSQREMDAMNNPRGRGFTNPRGKVRGRMPRLPINAQTGKLRNSGRIVRRDIAGRFSKSSEWRLEVHGVPYAKYIIPRKARPGSKIVYTGFWDELAKRQKDRRYKRQAQFRRRAAS